METLSQKYPDRERLFFQSFRYANDAMVICDLDGNLLEVNQAFNEIFGFEPLEVIGKNISILRHPDAPNRLFRGMWRALKDPKVGYWRGEICNKRKNGSAVDMFLTIASIIKESGEIDGYTAIMLDNTRAKQLEAQMIQQEKLTSIGMIAAGMAHEMGTPLNVISGRAEMARALVSREPDAVKAMEIIIQQTERISGLVQALLKFSSPQTPASRENFEWIDLGEVLNECRGLLDEALKRNNIRFAVTTLDNPRLQWDFVSCEQVFVNLLQNAIAAVEGVAEPRIEVVVEMAPVETLENMEPLPKEGLRVIVKDNGSGISAENQGRIFDPFFTTKEVGVGTGLGLSVVYGLIHHVNGTISVQSQPNQGAAFEIILPVYPD